MGMGVCERQAPATGKDFYATGPTAAAQNQNCRPQRPRPDRVGGSQP